jgi:hypothetical protein
MKHVFGCNVFFGTPALQRSVEALSGGCFQNTVTSIKGGALSGGCFQNNVTSIKGGALSGGCSKNLRVSMSSVI